MKPWAWAKHVRMYAALLNSGKINGKGQRLNLRRIKRVVIAITNCYIAKCSGRGASNFTTIGMYRIPTFPAGLDTRWRLATISIQEKLSQPHVLPPCPLGIGRQGAMWHFRCTYGSREGKRDEYLITWGGWWWCCKYRKTTPYYKCTFPQLTYYTKPQTKQKNKTFMQKTPQLTARPTNQQSYEPDLSARIYVYIYVCR